ncbi:MAG: hypothetical protein ACOZNI_28000 [Myxococcota bacterium]
MRCYAYQLSTKLLQILSTAAVAVTTNGTTYRILPGNGDLQTDDAQDFRFVTSMNFSGGATSPTAQWVIQGSVDGSTWLDLATGVSRTAPGTYLEVIEAANVALLPYIRARLVLGGGTNPTVYGTVDAVSNGPFQLTT